MPKDKPVGSQVASREDVAAAERVYFRDACAFSERAVLIIVGATVTVLAGFLSQVWSSAGVPFRTELAKALVSFGWLFTACIGLPPLRIFALRPAMYSNWYSVPMFAAWSIGAVYAVVYYTITLRAVGDTILRYAAVATP